MKAKNICPKCGGRLLVEAMGFYGDVFRMKENGEMSKTRIRRHVYETSGSYLIYCEKCGHSVEAEDYGY